MNPKNIYIGMRYVPKYEGDWNELTEYEPLSIVKGQDGNGYTSKKPVPAGTPTSNSEYWALTGSGNTVTDALSIEVNTLKEEMEKLKDLPTLVDEVENKIVWNYSNTLNGDGSSDNKAAFEALNENEAISLKPGTYLISGDCTINCPIEFLPGAVIKWVQATPNTMCTVTFNKGFKYNGGEIFDGYIKPVTPFTTLIPCVDWYKGDFNDVYHFLCSTVYDADIVKLGEKEYTLNKMPTSGQFSDQKRGINLIGCGKTKTTLITDAAYTNFLMKNYYDMKLKNVHTASYSVFECELDIDITTTWRIENSKFYRCEIVNGKGSELEIAGNDAEFYNTKFTGDYFNLREGKFFACDIGNGNYNVIEYMNQALSFYFCEIGSNTAPFFVGDYQSIKNTRITFEECYISLGVDNNVELASGGGLLKFNNCYLSSSRSGNVPKLTSTEDMGIVMNGCKIHNINCSVNVGEGNYTDTDFSVSNSGNYVKDGWVGTGKTVMGYKLSSTIPATLNKGSSTNISAYIQEIYTDGTSKQIGAVPNGKAVIAGGTSAETTIGDTNFLKIGSDEAARALTIIYCGDETKGLPACYPVYVNQD